MAVDASGNIVLAGLFAGALDLGGPTLTSAGGTDFYVVKFDPAGNHVWSRRFGDQNPQGDISIDVDPQGNVLLAGSFTGSVSFGGATLTSAGQSDIFIAKLGASGTHVWSKKFGGSDSETARAIGVDASGAAVVSGRYRNTVDVGGGALPKLSSNATDYAGFLAKFDASGNHVWSTAFGGEGQIENDQDLKVDGQAVVLVAGFDGIASFGGADLDAGGAPSTAVVRYTSSGGHVWSRRAAPTYLGYGASDTNDDVFTTLNFTLTLDFDGVPSVTSSGDSDLLVVKLDSGGNHVWSKRFGDASAQAPRAIEVAPTGDVMVVGNNSGAVDFGGGAFTSAGASDAFVAMLTTGGAHLWSAGFGDASEQGIEHLRATDGAVIVAGHFQSTIELGGETLTSAGGTDVFVAAFTP